MAKDTDFNTASGTWRRAYLLSDGSWAFESLGSIPNDQHIYLNAGTYGGTINLAANTDYATASGTHWALETLSDSTVALKSLGSYKNPKYQYLNVDTYNGSVGMAANTDYASASGTHWEIVTLVAGSAGGATVTGTLGGAVTGAAGAVAGAATDAAGAIQGAAEQAGGALQSAGQDIASGFCGIFSC